jgi:hypothetical protein
VSSPEDAEGAEDAEATDLCAGYVTAHDTLDSVTTMYDVEIEDAAHREAGHFQVRAHLGDMYWMDVLNGFDLDDHGIPHDVVEPERGC